MTIHELTKIITETLIDTEKDLKCYTAIAAEVIELTIQVMDALEDMSLDQGTRARDMKRTLLVQKIVNEVRARVNVSVSEIPH